MRLPLILALLTLPAAAGAQQCTGEPTRFRCIEADGTISDVEIVGPRTTTTGRNPATGETWSNTSQKTGRLTKTIGRAADGSKWEWTSQTIGNRTFTHGVDSQGRSFSYYCDPFGCH